jgi:tetratricopeptide (TPR) repeat protein
MQLWRLLKDIWKFIAELASVFSGAISLGELVHEGLVFWDVPTVILICFVFLLIGTAWWFGTSIYRTKRPSVVSLSDQSLYVYGKCLRIIALVLPSILTIFVVGIFIWLRLPPRNMIVLVADFDYNHPDKHFGVTQKLVERLRKATEFDGVEVKVLGKRVKWENGSSAARAEGEKRRATIVIWGDYEAPRSVAAISIHFELLNDTIRRPIEGGIVRKSLVRETLVPVAELENFTIQEELSGQMVYLTLLVSGLARYAAGDLRSAVDRFSRAIDSAVPRTLVGSDVPYFFRGTAYLFLGLDKDAEKDLSKAIELNPGCSECFNNRGNVRADLNLAMADFDRAIELNPRNVLARVSRGRCWRRKGRLDLAIVEYNKAIADDPKCFAALVCRGVARSQQGDLDAAIKDYDRALELAPRSAETFDDRGVAFMYKGDCTRAIADHTRAIKLSPRMAEAFINRGNAWSCTGNLQRAIQDYDTAIELSPRSAVAECSRGLARFKMGQTDLAILDYDKAIKLDPDFLGAYLARSDALLRKRDFRRAFADLSYVCNTSTEDRERQYSCQKLRSLQSLLGGDGN